jgi:1-phosphofructokinase family hexose kinase
MILTVCANPSVDSFWAVDQIEKGTTTRSEYESFFPGGKGIHVAFALNELGAEVATLGIWGGQTGKWIREKCADCGINTIGLAVEQWTRICITTKSQNDWDGTEILGAGPEIRDPEADQFMDLFEEFVDQKKPEAVVISGSIPRGFDEGSYQQMITIANEHKIPSFVDASGSVLRKALDASPFSVHINLQEGKELSGYKDPDKIARWLSKYCTAAAVTAGADGLYLFVDEVLYHASIQLKSSQIHSTVGAGDCLLAGLCLAVLKSDDPVHWAKLSAACGSANCINPDLGMLKESDVHNLIEKVELEKSEVHG